MRLASHFISFSQRVDKFNNTRARMLDSLNHMTDYFEISFLAYKSDYFVITMQRCYGRHNISRKSVVVYWFLTWHYFTPRRNVI